MRHTSLCRVLGMKYLVLTTVLGFDRIGPKFGGIHPFRTGPRKNGTGQNISAQFEFSAQPMVSSSLHKPSIAIKAQTQK